MDITPIMENQMEKNIENEMEAGILCRLIGLILKMLHGSKYFSPCGL